MGVGERALRLECDAWILTQSVGDQDYQLRFAEKIVGFDDPETMRLHHAITEAIDWDSDDARLPRLIDGRSGP